jgi:hypothetical protein
MYRQGQASCLEAARLPLDRLARTRAHPPMHVSRACARRASPTVFHSYGMWERPLALQMFFVLRNRFINIYIMDKHFMLKNIMFARTHVTQGVDRDLRSSRVVSHANAWASLNALSRLSLRLRIGRHIAIS